MIYSIDKHLILENVFRNDKIQNDALRNTLVNNATTGQANDLTLAGAAVPLVSNIGGVIANNGNGHGAVGLLSGTRGVLGANSNNVGGIALKDAYANRHGFKTAGIAAAGALGLHATGLDDDISDLMVDGLKSQVPGQPLSPDEIAGVKEHLHQRHDEKIGGTTLMAGALGAAAPAMAYGAGKLFGTRQNYRNVNKV